MVDRSLSDVDVVGQADIARRAGVAAVTVEKWRARFDDFPVPVLVLREGRPGQLSYWDWAEVDKWRREKGLGR